MEKNRIKVGDGKIMVRELGGELRCHRIQEKGFMKTSTKLRKSDHRNKDP